MVKNFMHLVLDCKRLKMERANTQTLQRPREDNSEEVVERFSFGDENLKREKQK